jgi:hypothetical protein
MTAYDLYINANIFMGILFTPFFILLLFVCISDMIENARRK